MIRAPFVGNFAAQIENDRLDRFGHLGLRILFLQAIALDEGALHPAMLLGAVVVERRGEVADAFVEVASPHRLLRQQQKAGVEDETQSRRYALFSVLRRLAQPVAIGNPGLVEADVDVVRERP